MAADDTTPPPGEAKPLKRPSEATEAQSATPDDVGMSELNGLYKVARTQPFMRNFYRTAHARFAARATPETRVKQMIEAHPLWYKFCWWADTVLLAIVLLGGLGVAGIAIYKTIWL